MTDPVTVDIPHSLTQADVRAKMDGGITKLAGMFPGGSVVDHRWEDDRTMTFTVSALGQRVASRVELLEGRVRATIDLPPMLALFADKLRSKLAKDGPGLLK
ncbi:polyhydroxyalkanoic acid system family protein [Sphingomonas qomolangmaensis]|uniref:Polyhydroxyalkanoic acid system family protein n=1 Tax=Sphingomonas qomolangmaensis TaxID=2918765 RepID=A0ABY5L6J0_9SPHN|nr:polyhydroxyalkanoic acid system family protein [Sphingomonas qomolangmaensis]UUL81683.1 polyhydroxyalkanoic acid system family protein [Sphingomonas qomolangmaensis]